jgi:NADH-quinone oxidoreductase subunit G
VRGFGSQHIDHRLRQTDFSADASEPIFPALGATLAALEEADAILIIGGYPRHDQPLINHRIRKAALRGAPVIALDTLDQAYNFDLAAQITVAPSRLVVALGGLVRACVEAGGTVAQGLASYAVDAASARIATLLAGGQRIQVLAGNQLQAHPQRAILLGLLSTLAMTRQAHLGLLTDGANAAGAWLAGAVPHRGPAGRQESAPGHPMPAMLRASLSTYLLLGIEPDADCADPVAARAALQSATSVAALTAFTTPSLEAVATLLLPIASFVENEGSYVNAAGAWQTFTAAVKPPGAARAAWKILRAVGAQRGVAGFDAVTCVEVTRELRELCGPLTFAAPVYTLASAPSSAVAADGLERITRIPLYRTDALVRRAGALQQMPQAGDDHLHVSPATLARLGLAAEATARVEAGGSRASARVLSDPSVPDGCCLIYGATDLAAKLSASGRVTVQTAGPQRD